MVHSRDCRKWFPAFLTRVLQCLFSKLWDCKSPLKIPRSCLYILKNIHNSRNATRNWQINVLLLCLADCCDFLGCLDFCISRKKTQNSPKVRICGPPFRLPHCLAICNISDTRNTSKNITQRTKKTTWHKHQNNGKCEVRSVEYRLFTIEIYR